MIKHATPDLPSPESDANIAAILRGYVERFELTSPIVKNMMLDAAARIERLEAAMQEACDLLAERKHGSQARSAGHNARLCLEAALAGKEG